MNDYAVLIRRFEHARDGDKMKVVEVLNRTARYRAGARLASRNLNSQRRLEGKFKSELRRNFDSMGRYVANVAAKQPLVIDAFSESVHLIYFGEFFEVSDREANGVEAILASAYLRDWADENIRPTYESHWLAVAQRSVNVINSEMNVGIRLSDRSAGRIIDEGGRRLGLLDLKNDTRRALYRTIAVAREKQMGPIEIAREIQSQVPKGSFPHAGSRYRAELIARSETLHASRRSSFEVYRDADNVIGLLAHDALLGDSDPECEDRDGREFTFEEAEAAMMETHPQCTLNFSPVTR